MVYDGDGDRDVRCTLTRPVLGTVCAPVVGVSGPTLRLVAPVTGVSL